MDNRPIGVFDSGLGGLTAVRELMRLMPREAVVYFGDTGRTPYGTKAPETIRRFATQDVRFLLSHGVKAVVVACATASSAALPLLKNMAPCPVLGAIEPAARAAVAATRSGRIGVLGTAATIRSGAFGRAVRARMPGALVTGRACPMFVPLVENGYFGRGCLPAELFAHEYLDPLRGTLDTLILGCTHYPILADVIGGVMGPDVALVDTGRELARETAALLSARGLTRSPDAPEGDRRFFVSDRAGDFARLAGILLGGDPGPVGLVDIDRYDGSPRGGTLCGGTLCGGADEAGKNSA